MGIGGDFPRSDDPPELDGDLEFQVIDWFVPENDKSKQRRDREDGYTSQPKNIAPAEYEIFMFGTTADGYSVTAKVKGFQPYFYVKVPYHWTQEDVNDLREKFIHEKQEFRKKNGEIYQATIVRYTLRDHLVSMKLEMHKDFWGFTNFKDFKFMRVTVKSLRLFNDLKRYFMTKPTLYSLYEANIDPFLRFIHERNIQPCGWVRLPAETYDVKDPDGDEESDNNNDEDEDLPYWQRTLKPNVTPCAARTNYCIEVGYSDVIGLAYNKIAPLLVASFDIECTSSHGDFPVAIKNYRKLSSDLIAWARSSTSKLTADDLCKEIPQAFFDVEQGGGRGRIHKLYAKRAKHLVIEDIRAKVHSIADDILSKVYIAAANRGKKANPDADELDSESDEEDATPTPITSKAASAAEFSLTALLTKHLPPLAGDPIIQIGTTVHRYGSDKIIYRHIATYKSCADIADAEVEARKKESECIMAWKDFITRLDPDILTGYNIFGFDAKYIAERAKELGIYDELVHGLGRLKHRHCDIEERSLSSSALGDNIMYCFDLDGLVQIDMLKVMQRDHKLDSYKLDAVAGKFIVESAEVTSITPPVLKTHNTSGLKDGNYIRLDNSDKIQVNDVTSDGMISLAEELPASLAQIGQKVTWAIVKDDISPNEIFAKFAGSSRDRMDIAKYCLQDCALVNRLLHKLKVLENNIGMGNVCYVPLSYLFMRGQGVKIFSLVARECRLKNHLIPMIKISRGSADETDGASDEVGYEGAIVLPPKEGMYLDDPITVLDYSSLYPSSMISRNISHDALIIDKKYREEVESDPTCGITFHDVVFDEYEGKGDAKRKVGEKACTFAQFPEGKKGIVPSILQMLLTQRKNTRKKIEYETLVLTSGKEVHGLIKTLEDGTVTVTDVDTNQTQKIASNDIKERKETFNEFEKAVLDARQLAYKVTANSLYGQTGSKTSPIFLLEVAACTTATGRGMIMLAKNFVETQYGAEVIYGDTDSIFCKFKNDGKKGREALPLAIEAGQRASKEIKALLPSPQCLEYEKTLWPFILFSKKRYVGNLYEDDHTKKPKQKSMGIVLKRRDNAPIVKRVYGGIINILMTSGNLTDAVEFLKKCLQDLVEGQVPLEELIISKTLKSDYKDPSKIAHKVLADRMGERDPGNKPMVNDRIPFVYIVPPNGTEVKLQGDRIEHPDYIRHENLKPDYQFYITNQLLKPISQLFALCVTQISGYTLAPNYWEQIDVELEGMPRYTDDKKRKTRITNLKMQQVKDILFDPYISVLASPSSRAKRSKSTGKAGKNGKAGEAGKSATTTYRLELQATEKKRGSKYDCTATMMNGETELWKIEKPITGTKGSCLRMIAMQALNKAATAEDIKDKIEISDAIVVSCADKVFMRSWRKAIDESKNADHTEGMRRVHETQDIADLKEQNELIGFLGLVYARQSIKYILG